MNNLFTEEMLGKIKSCGVLAVIVIDDANDAEPLAEALLKGGINTIELTLRTPSALKAISIIRHKFPEILCGAGTVLNEEQVKQVVDAGANFAVAPGTNAKTISKALSLKIPFAPGIATPSDIETALEFGCRILKFFPAESLGGMKYLNDISAPYNHLGLKFIPLGGINSDNMVSYLKSELIIAVGGSWIAKRDVIKKRDWSLIAKTASEAIQSINRK